MTTTIPFVAYEVSGLSKLTYNSGAVNFKSLKDVSGAIWTEMATIQGSLEGDTPLSWGTLTAGAGIAAITGVGISGSGDHDVVVLGYSTISSQAKSAYMSASTGVFAIDTRTLTAGNGLTGGGTLEADRTFAVGAGTGIAVTADAVEVMGYSNISSNAKKAKASAQIAFYESSDVDHDATTNFVANEHIDHTGVSITAGNGLTGGGTIAATRDIAVGAGTGIQVNANDIEVLGYATISSNAANAAAYQASGNEYSAAYASAQALKIHAFHAKISSAYLAANHGWSQITSGSKRIVHSLAGAPNIVNITPSGMITFAYAVYNPNATDFTVAITAAGSRVIRWHAQI